METKFDLGELMLPDHAARVFSGCARFGAEARRAGGEAHRQLRFVEDGFADEVGEGNFGSGDEPIPLWINSILSNDRRVDRVLCSFKPFCLKNSHHLSHGAFGKVIQLPPPNFVGKSQKLIISKFP